MVQQVFELVRRIRQEGLTVLIVEQNVAQVLRVVDRAYVLETGPRGRRRPVCRTRRRSRHSPQLSRGTLSLDPFFLEALVNGILLGGVFALPALGLNLVFGVVDVVWLCYAELVMVGMYAVWFLYTQLGWPLWLAFAACLPIIAPSACCCICWWCGRC